MNGILVIDKPQGLTSFDVVAKVRRALHTKKCGHTGTLDPMATGVLPILLGSATKLSPFLMDTQKEYIATMLLGRSTDTLDITGTTIEQVDPETIQISEAAVRQVLGQFLGENQQEPPMYSALKKDGQRLYDLARQGITLELEKRPVTIYELELLQFELPYITFRAVTSKGTYIRSLIRDLGQELGVPAVMSALRRTLTGGFTLEQSVTLEELDSPGILGKIIQVEEPLLIYPELKLDDPFIGLLKNGVKLKDGRAVSGLTEGSYRIKTGAGEFIGLADYTNEELVLTWRV